MPFKGWKTFAYGGLLVVLPPLLAFVGQIDWAHSGLPPWAVMLIGAGVIALRSITSTPPGRADHD